MIAAAASVVIRRSRFGDLRYPFRNLERAQRAHGLALRRWRERAHAVPVLADDAGDPTTQVVAADVVAIELEQEAEAVAVADGPADWRSRQAGEGA